MEFASRRKSRVDSDRGFRGAHDASRMAQRIRLACGAWSDSVHHAGGINLHDGYGKTDYDSIVGVGAWDLRVCCCRLGCIPTDRACRTAAA